MMIPLVPVIVSQNAYIPYLRALRFRNSVQGTAACGYERQLLKAGDAALLLPQAARCKGPPDRLLIAHEACSACFVPMTAKSVSEVRPSNFWGAHHFEASVREKG